MSFVNLSDYGHSVVNIFTRSNEDLTDVLVLVFEADFIIFNLAFGVANVFQLCASHINAYAMFIRNNIYEVTPIRTITVTDVRFARIGNNCIVKATDLFV